MITSSSASRATIAATARRRGFSGTGIARSSSDRVKATIAIDTPNLAGLSQTDFAEQLARSKDATEPSNRRNSRC